MNTLPSRPSLCSIMIVDDTPANLSILTETLTSHGYHARPAPSGRLALQAMKAEPPDLILMDINMPEMTGYEVCEVMQRDSQLKGIPVIFLSALTETEDKLKGFALGGVDYITKPFQIEEVIARISTHLQIRYLQEQLGQSERRYRLLTENMRDLVWSMDLAGKLTFVSPSAIPLLGFTPAELLEISPADLFTEEIIQKISQYLTSITSSPALVTKPLHFSMEIIRKDNTAIISESLVSPIFDDRGTPIGIVGTTRDITERQEAEQQLLRQKQDLAVFQERERIGRELHDSLGQVLSFVNTQTQMIQEMIAKENVAAATIALGQLSMVAHDANADIREFIRQSQNPPDEIGFFEGIRSFLEKFSQISRIQTYLSLPPEINENVIAPQGKIQLMRIIQEALTNARKYAHAKTIQVILTLSDISLQLIVADDGVGFDPEEAANQTGLHFGINIMRERAVEIGGELQIRSAPNQGTQIIAHFPRVFPKHTALQSLTFFLVDDHPLILEGITNLLKQHGIKVIGAAKNGEIALGIIKQLHPDVVLMDLHLPGMDGVEATKQIKSMAPDIRVVFLTLSMESRDINRAIQAGASGYLLKHQNPDEFLLLLDRLVNGEVAMAPEIMNGILYSIGQNRSRTTVSEVESTLLAAGLTAQQIEILKDVAQGMEYKQIAAALQISPHTVKYHFAHILDCLKFSSRAEAVSYAFQVGLVTGRRLNDV